MEIEIIRSDNRAFLKIGETTVEVKSYKISSSMHSDTELEVVIAMKEEITDFLVSSKRKSRAPYEATPTDGCSNEVRPELSPKELIARMVNQEIQNLPHP